MTPQDIAACLTAGSASLVEFVEALTVILAVGATHGWRPALGGAAAAVMLLGLLLVVSGEALLRVPLRPAQFVLGLLLLLFGLRWLRKATRRAGGRIPLRDERAAYDRHRARFASAGPTTRGSRAKAAAIAFQATTIEGLEVVFVVVAVGAGGSGLLRPSVLGASSAFLLVALLGVALHRPIAHVPDNTLKRVVGAVLSGFGTFWVGEGAGLSWPGRDLAAPILIACYLALSLLLAARLRRRLPR